LLSVFFLRHAGCLFERHPEIVAVLVVATTGDLVHFSSESTHSFFARSMRIRCDSCPGGRPAWSTNDWWKLRMDKDAAARSAPMNQSGKLHWFICALLFFACVVNYMDRQVPGLHCACPPNRGKASHQPSFQEKRSVVKPIGKLAI